MPRRPAARFRYRLHARVFALLLLVLGLVTMPVLAAMGELHELAHDPASMHAFSGHGAAQDDGQDEPQEEGGSDALHTLIHFAHCCGQSPLASLPGLVFVAFSAGADALLLPEPQVLSQASSLAPFRPPITT